MGLLVSAFPLLEWRMSFKCTLRASNDFYVANLALFFLLFILLAINRCHMECSTLKKNTQISLVEATPTLMQIVPNNMG